MIGARGRYAKTRKKSAPIVAAAGGGNWSSTATWVGGVVPTAADDVQLTGSSGNVTIDAGAVCRSLDCTGYAGTLTHTAAVTLTIGSAGVAASAVALKLVSGMTYTLGNAVSSAISFVSTNPAIQTIDSSNKPLGNMTINGAGGNYVAASNLNLANTGTSFTLTKGTFDASTFNVTAGLVVISGTNARTLHMGSGTWTCNTTGTVWNATTTTALTFDSGTSKIVVASANSSAKSFVGGNLPYYDISFTAGGTGIVTISGSNTWHDFTVNPPKSLKITSASVQTVTGTPSLTGTSGNLITIASTTGGSAGTLSKASGTVNCDYLSLQDSAAAGGATWHTGANSTNVSGNSGWLFP